MSDLELTEEEKALLAEADAEEAKAKAAAKAEPVEEPKKAAAPRKSKAAAPVEPVVEPVADLTDHPLALPAQQSWPDGDRWGWLPVQMRPEEAP